MSAPAGSSQALTFFASLCLPFAYPKKEEEQQKHLKLFPARIDGRRFLFFVTILAAMVSNLANGEVTMIQPSDTHGSLRGDYHRELAITGTTSFAYTGGVQIW